MRIPKKIHFCWYGKGEYSEVIKKCIQSWSQKLPDYEIKKWDESNTPFEKLPFLRILYKQKKWSFISDYMRLYSIYTEGGIYLDKQRLHFNAMGGPPIVTSVLYNYGLNTYKKQHLKKVLLLPTEYFYPFTWFEKFTSECITENTICIHWWEDSWTNKKKDAAYFIDSIKRKIKKTPLILFNRIKYVLNKEKFYHINKMKIE